MTIKSRQLFILIGNDESGKTTLQKLLIEKIYGYLYGRLPVNQLYNITHPEIKRKYQTIFFANRSYQEKKDTYGTVEEYFQNHFQIADISFISSHLIITDINEMIRQGKRRFYNVGGVFLSNSIVSGPSENAEASALDWDERFFVENPPTDDSNQVSRQLNLIAENIIFLLVNRTNIS